ncbi:CBS domain-containing protein [Streptacidiphilus sp. PAMC 29251]
MTTVTAAVTAAVTATATAAAQGAPPAAWDGLPRHTPVSELMNRQVVTVDPWTDYATLVTALHGHPHQLLAVVDAQRRVLGVVGAGDLLARLAVAALPQPTRFGAGQAWALRRRAAGVMASELMSAPVRTVGPDTSAPEAARLAARWQVHQLLVTDAQQRPVGLVCRCDLLRAVCRDDAAIRSEVLYLAVAAETGADRATLRVDCEHGRVLLDARTARRSQAYTLLGRVRAVEGVVQVAETLRWDTDDQPVAMRQHPSHQL